MPRIRTSGGPAVVLLFVASGWLYESTAFLTTSSSRRAPPKDGLTRSVSRPPLYAARRADVTVELGSEANHTSADQDDYDVDYQEHQAQVEALLTEARAVDVQERKQKVWGAYANVQSADDIATVAAQEDRQWTQEQAWQAQAAAASGISLQLLEADDEAAVFDPTDQMQLVSGSGGGGGFMEEVDEELAAEWQALTEQPTNGDDEPSNGPPLPIRPVAASQRAAGVRVGSAGGWSLEVFPGDFVVHRKYGIGRFERTCLRPKTRLSAEEKEARDQRRGELLTQELRKLKQVTTDDIQKIRSTFGTEEDKDPVSNPQTTVLEIAYADATVHVPVDRAYRLSRYRAGDSVVKPKLSRVQGEAWAKAKQKVEANTKEMAQDVLALYARRETLSRQPSDPQKETLVRNFETSFAFEPTPDQQQCFDDVENDMVWRNQPMDRLVCGDVGFGKTEVAMRAIYRAIKNGRQAAFLAPTTVLAAQHYKNIIKRMGPDTEFGIEAVMLRGSNSLSSKTGQYVREVIKEGSAQLVVGTHSLLSKSVEFSNLGLLVVDEEQRFGVKQKERLKLVCDGIDVLTLSATPIPRTLQMSLSGIRDTSTIRSPPPMRKPTITYVQDYSDDLVKLAIEKELERGGQCFYVVPRISMLDEAESTIKRLFPDIRIIQAHGRMRRNGAEENVASFAEGDFDVLLATTVIENGVDIPSVNTIVVQDSQFFGISALYQLRGRVGRSDKQAYAYFLHSDQAITEKAVMRLQAIGELNELGSGFDVANRDLEIRGAGSLLGTEQSGMAARVGFDLYMRMLKKSIRDLRGLDLPLILRTNILIPMAGSPDTFALPESMIPDEAERTREESRARLSESTNKLVELTNQWKETYGTLPAKVQKNLKTLHLHACTRRLGVDLVGLVDMSDEDHPDRTDLILRSPGLRPRHLAMIAPMLKGAVAPKGLDILIPGRYTASGDDEEVLGGRRVNFEPLIGDGSVVEEESEEDYDQMDLDEVEAMKVISGASRVKDMESIDVELYPRLVVRNFVADAKMVDRLLKLLLPVAKVVYEVQQAQAEEAKTASTLREKQEMINKQKKTNKARGGGASLARRYGGALG